MNIGLSRYFIRMVLFILLLGTVPLFFLGFFSYSKSTAISREQAIKGNMSMLYQTEMRVEQLLKTVENAVTQLQSSSLIQTMKNRTLTQYEFQYFDELLSQIHHLQSYENGIQDVTLVNYQQDWIGNNRILTSLSGLPKKENIDVYVQDPRNAYWTKELPIDQIPPGMSTSYGINFIKKVPLHAQNQKPVGLFITKITSLELNKILSNSSTSGKTMILDEHYQVIGSTQAGDLGKSYSSFSDVRLLSDGRKEGYFENEFEEQASGVMFLKSAYNGWSYIYIIPISEITKESRVIGWITISILLGIAVVILATSYIIARRMYLPIKQLVETIKGLTNTNAGDDIRSDEFQFISGRVAKMKDTHVKLENQIQSQYQYLRELFIFKLFQGKVSQSEINENLTFYGYFENWKRLNVISIQIDTLKDTRYEARNLDLLLFAISNIVSELIPMHRRLSPIQFDKFQVTILGSESENVNDVKSDLYERADRIQSTVKNVLGLEVSIGISNCYEHITNTPNAYHESIEALRYRIRLSEASILLHEDVQTGDSQTLRFPDQIEIELIDAIKLADTARVEELLNAFLESVFSTQLDFRLYQMAFVRLLVDLDKIVQPYGISLSTLYEGDHSVFVELFELKTVDEMKAWLQDSIIGRIVGILEEQRKSQYQRLSEQMLELIHERFHTDLTLEACSKALNYHPNYLKRVFRGELGVNFSDYLILYRMNIAKKWLVDTDMRISEIALKIGYSTSQNFIRNFRKTEGITPGQFREKL
ncbi:helix-turn-helix domain-containing protein [Paenibacillus radicis (ex Xue et al. 2023)]|uniref:Helix-turn-helix domain-containing protein n=1 Tax=Paenibacillus radicis (ex Xue et al. 2023) TaxID=2972489 RepID=A0ABT1YQA2_9BACL|nr:helix-turn-helix domain-containing protein [Paenibacillus radicis (ex Xue et al. 2023)]MCR8635350.1 helix-turn-helix domain-containing protein [Paenibacillus radicis (ex Xue et al. 2023)]